MQNGDRHPPATVLLDIETDGREAFSFSESLDVWSLEFGRAAVGLSSRPETAPEHWFERPEFSPKLKPGWATRLSQTGLNAKGNSLDNLHHKVVALEEDCRLVDEKFELFPPSLPQLVGRIPVCFVCGGKPKSVSLHRR
ncbi:unnamed protein product [Calypogeia fissa]